MKPITAVELAELLGIKKRSARSRLSILVKAGKAIRLNKNVGPNNPGLYHLRIPLKELFATNYDTQLARYGKVNYKNFCSDPFNLTRENR